MESERAFLSIGFTGDVMIGRLVEEVLTESDPSYIWGDTLPVLNSTDINIINLEAALTNSDRAIYKTFNFRAKPERVEVLKLASVDVVNLANNHTLDYSEEGLIETLKVLKNAKIPYVGAGENLDEARMPVIIERKGVKVGILGFTDNEPSWIATKHSPGTNYIDINMRGLEVVKDAVEKLRKDVDIVILSIHWGPNMRERPTQRFQEFARGVIDSGVDIFHGHSAHIFQGIEIYKKKVIFYDTGDFVDDYYVDPVLRNDHSFFNIAEVSKDGIAAVRLIPTHIGNCQVNLARGIEKEETMKRMQMLSKELGTLLNESSEGILTKVL